MTSLDRNTIGSAIGKSFSVCDLILRTFVAGFGWNTFLRWAANVSALFLSLRAKQFAGVLVGATVTVGGLSVEWAFHSGNFELDGDSCFAKSIKSGQCVAEPGETQSSLLLGFIIA